MSKLAMVLTLLSDGKWHATEELLLRLKLNEHDLQEIMAFLDNYGFVKVDVKNKKVKISRDFRRLEAQADSVPMNER